MAGCYFHITDEAQAADTYHYTVEKQQGVPFQIGDFLENIKRQFFRQLLIYLGLRIVHVFHRRKMIDILRNLKGW